MNKKPIHVLILILNIITALILCILMYHMAIFIDEHNVNLSDVFGGRGYGYLYWFAMLFALISAILSLVNILKRK